MGKLGGETGAGSTGITDVIWLWETIRDACVTLYIDFENGGSVCSGIFIGVTCGTCYILTAGHCVAEREEDSSYE